MRELAGVATSGTVEGARTDWSMLLEAELEKARQIVDPAPPPPVSSVPGALLEGCQIQDLAELIPKLLEPCEFNVAALVTVGPPHRALGGGRR